MGGLLFHHDAIRRLLTERCDRLLVILSPDFVLSKLNEYVVKLAQSLGITEGTRKIIPCLYRPCNIPDIFRHIYPLRYQQNIYNFVEKLIVSLKTTSAERKVNRGDWCRLEYDY